MSGGLKHLKWMDGWMDGRMDGWIYMHYVDPRKQGAGQIRQIYVTFPKIQISHNIY
jgi:hypothetical protein